jgi:oxalyl-CoA decarboxylase
VQLDISPSEIDSNRPIVAPVVGDIKSAMSALLAALKPGQIQARPAWLDQIAQHKQKNVVRMTAQLNADPHPMNFSSALRAVRDALAGRSDLYIVNEGANTLDFARNIIDMYEPRKRLDSGTWGVMGIGMGYAIGAAVVSGKGVVAIEGDSAFGFSGMEIETICRYRLPIVILVFNNGGIYHGDKIGGAPSPTGFIPNARYDKLIEAFGGTGYHVTDKASLGKALTDAVAAGRPALINCVIDPAAGTESGHIQSFNPKSALAKEAVNPAV